MFFKRSKISNDEKDRIQNERELNEYNKRQEKYNDMLRDEIQKQRFKNKMNKIKVDTFTKKMVAFIVVVCIIDLQLSYILAFLGKASTIENLSSQICITILGVAFGYMIRAYFAIKSENQNIDQKIKNDIIDNVMSKVDDVIKINNANNCKESDKDVENSDILKGGFHINIKPNNGNNDN